MIMKDDDSLINHETKRIFIAVNLDLSIKKELSDIQQKITIGDSKIKWVYPELMHITLEFLGNQLPKQIEIIRQILKRITGHCKTFVIDLSSSIGVFPSLKKPRVIWVGIDKGSIELEMLSKLIKTDLQKKHLLSDNKEFRSHITIGRVKYLNNRNSLTDSIDHIVSKKISQKVNSIELMESKLTPTGPIYREIISFPLFD